MAADPFSRHTIAALHGAPNSSTHASKTFKVFKVLNFFSDVSNCAGEPCKFLQENKTLKTYASPSS